MFSCQGRLFLPKYKKTMPPNKIQKNCYLINTIHSLMIFQSLTQSPQGHLQTVSHQLGLGFQPSNLVPSTLLFVFRYKWVPHLQCFQVFKMLNKSYWCETSCSLQASIYSLLTYFKKRVKSFPNLLQTNFHPFSCLINFCYHI